MIRVHIRIRIKIYNKSQNFAAVTLEWEHLLWNNQCKCTYVGRNIFSEIYFYLDIYNREFEILFLLADIEREKWVKYLIVARSYVGLGYKFIHTKEFNSKQGCTTIHPRKFLVGERPPRKFLVGERQIIINCGYRSEFNIT